MNVWIVRDLEPIPTDPGHRRLMRAGMLAQALASLGHETRWFTSSFDHYLKRQRLPHLQEIQAQAHLTITVLPGPGYRRNISLARIRHNRVFAKAFAQLARGTRERPDVIVTDLPTTEAAAASIAFGKMHGVPTVLSIRDLWPDFFSDHLPAALRPAARVALYPLERQVRFACANATSLVGISPGYLEWGRRKGRRGPSSTDKIFPLGYAPRPATDDSVADAFLARIGIRTDAKVVAFIGSWGHTYDLPLLLNTARLLSGRGDIQFLVAGDGAQAEGLKPLFATLPNVVLPGWIDADEIGVVLRRADVGLLPYHRKAPQGWPNKAFEYLGYGVYQIATLKGELGTLYNQTDGGLALAAPDADALAHAISRALDDPAIALSRRQRIARFEERYNSDAIYAAFSEHIAQLVQEARAGSGQPS